MKNNMIALGTFGVWAWICLAAWALAYYVGLEKQGIISLLSQVVFLVFPVVSLVLSILSVKKNKINFIPLIFSVLLVIGVIIYLIITLKSI